MGDRMAPVPGVDPLFTDDDAEELIDYIAWKDTLCPGCGNPKHEAFDPANEWVYKAIPLQCHACAATRRAEKRLDVLDGVYIITEKSA